MRYVLALAVVVACGGDPKYRTIDGEIATLSWRCKDGSYTGSYVQSRSTRLTPCPATVSITCPDPAGGTREVIVVPGDVYYPDPVPPFTIASFCERVRKVGY